MSGAGGLLVFLVSVAAGLLALVLLGFLLWKLLKGLIWLIAAVARGIGWFVRHIFAFVAGIIGDSLRLCGHVLTAMAFVPAIALNILLNRWSAANHYGSALEAELMGGVNCIYRLAIGHVAKLLLLTPVVEGLERRLPDVVARAPGPDRPSGGANTFEGWKVTGSLAGGGSGGKLWLAEPLPEKRRELLGAGRPCPDKVVIKSFSLEEGSTLPQIVRENRALSAARDLGLVLEHELTAARFHYVMPFVPGDDLGTVTARLHAKSGPAGLDDEPLRAALGYTSDLLATLDRFHRAGLWHKDVKPSNILVSDGRVQLVDLGLITPLASAMTLTTHGTEYFRDPEMVKLALKGVKVHEVDGVKFDVYGAGAVLYSMVENSFPVHGSLSQISRRCPEALRWIVRRAMADMANRYGSAREMLADLRVVQSADDPFRVRPAELPSLAGAPDPAAAPAAAAAAPAVAGAAAPVAAGTHANESSRLAAGAPRRRWGRGVSFGVGRLAKGVMLAFAVMLLLPVAFAWFFVFSAPGAGPGARVGSAARPFVYEMPDAAAVESAPPPRPVREGVESLQPVSLDHRPPGSSPVLHTAPPPAGLVLLLDDLSAAADETLLAWRAGLQDDLRAAHFALLGCGDPQDDATLAVTGFTADMEIALLAGARATVGLSDPSDDEAVGRLLEWLEAQDERLDAVVWLGRSDPGQPVRTRVVARKAELASSVARAME